MNRLLFPHLLSWGFLAFAVVVMAVCSLVSQSSDGRQADNDTIIWNRYSSAAMGVSFDYPDNWEILNDDRQAHADVLLCPPESERVTGLYLNVNCIAFLYGDVRLRTSGDIEGYNAVFVNFRGDVDSPEDDAYDNYRVMRHRSHLEDSAINLTGLYRSKSDKIGMWQSTCAIETRTNCLFIFDRVLGTISFNEAASI